MNIFKKIQPNENLHNEDKYYLIKVKEHSTNFIVDEKLLVMKILSGHVLSPIIASQCFFEDVYTKYQGFHFGKDNQCYVRYKANSAGENFYKTHGKSYIKKFENALSDIVNGEFNKDDDCHKIVQFYLKCCLVESITIYDGKESTKSETKTKESEPTL